MKRWKIVLVVTLLALVVAFVASRPYWFFWKDGQWYVQPNSWRVKESQLSLRTGREKKFKTYTTTAELKTRMVLGLLNDDHLWEGLVTSAEVPPWESTVEDQKYTKQLPLPDFSLLDLIHLPDDVKARYCWTVYGYQVDVTTDLVLGNITLRHYTEPYIFQKGWEPVGDGSYIQMNDNRTWYLLEENDGGIWEVFHTDNSRYLGLANAVRCEYWNKQKNIHVSFNIRAKNAEIKELPTLEWFKSILE